MGKTNMEGRHDFGFQTGDWTVRHRKLQGRLTGSTEWVEFDGTCSAREVMDGLGNVEEQWLVDPAGAYHAAAFRHVNLVDGEWSIHWFDPRLAVVEPPVRGRFKDGVGTFVANDHLHGRPIVVRYVWSDITAKSARWEQAFSEDGGASWEVNWVMDFHRTSETPGARHGG
jgi:hypothetical protein